MQQIQTEEPRLAKPGAGLPFFEWAIAKYVLIPLRFRGATKESALKDFAAVSEAILALAAPLTEADLSKRRLIPRLQGLEDSSRYWSVAMTLQHLIIVNTRMKSVIAGLSKGVTPNRAGSTADVKPSNDVNPATIATEYEDASRQFVETISSINLASSPKVTYAHPWFGQLNATEWLLFAPLHQHVHKKQITEIIKRL
jgi:hypothetical protein